MTESVPELPVLRLPREGVPPVTDSPEAYEAAIDALAAGEGPVAIDTERAHGFRYYPRAWLIQLRRAGAGTVLLDPSAFAVDDHPADLSRLSRAIAPAEWIIHAATQDLPCLVEVGLVPTRLFDTELGARLLGHPRVSLGAMVEHYCGVTLLKEHSAADWSTRPLPEDWLVYAALDVELLVELRDRISADLVAASKDEWARQEFAHLVTTAGDARPPRADPWRRVSGIHDLRGRRALAVVRELWQTRDAIAARRDKAPGRILNDRAIVAAAARAELRAGDLTGMGSFRKGVAHRYLASWGDAVRRVETMAPADYPAARAARTGPGAPRTWQSQHPAAYARFEAARDAIHAVAAEHTVPPENLIAPDTWHQLCWEPPAPVTGLTVSGRLAELGARPWQIDLVAGPLSEALAGQD